MERLTVPAKKLDDGRTVMPIIDGRAVREHAMDFYWRLKEYEDLEEQGLLLKLPCKVGDKVWDIAGKKIREQIVDGIECRPDGFYIYANEDEWLGKLGKLVFLTKAEAEKTLAEMEK